ncbi:hypothetical protein PC129_g13042 [Phytophthora cactorum]|uniref:DDE-1 domain-containing protein n=1 Tax=Phytophthora cactorum TaxID=29920 RepID=A0A8T1FIX7_9STRA|nr:hypothetical protein PC111_g18556 [Phytophthora cactorum]KAG2839973.1 hypothetical protein PC113_g19358 [Phytophthora cactorum]KAG2882171.1 hypothetical protein PC114_g21179 [Phytophthora cactorum]KAG2892351.1 hypothetical protein PC115_g18861 [Phytophthora cactorum]KAG2904622.1 hypothetical protein PC117_g20991 [Phytophthora cactorum]
MHSRRKQRTYTVKEKQVAVLLVQDVGVEEAARILGYPRSSVSSWSKQAEKLLDFKGTKTYKTLKGQGRKELFPGVAAIVTYMKDLLSTVAIIDRMWAEDPQWVAEYISSRKSGVLALERLCQRLANRNVKVPKKTLEELQVVRAGFALKFWGQYGQYQSGGILNVDETGINFEMPPHRAWALMGRQNPAHIVGLKKHPGRLTAVLTTRADGGKLPILFIIRGKPGGRLEKTEIPTFPPGHFYIVQENAWMDDVGWKFYVERLLKYEFVGPSVLLLDNFESPVSEEGQRLVAEVASATTVPLPASSTAVCQPLDVGVVGPLKASIRGGFKGIRKGNLKTRRLRAIKATIAAWEALDTEVVKRSFEKAIPRYPEVMI